MNALVDLASLANRVETRENFLSFLDSLVRAYDQAEGNWGNNNLRSYLEGLSGFTQDIDGYYKNRGEIVDIDAISWRMAAQMLCAAIVYE